MLLYSLESEHSQFTGGKSQVHTLVSTEGQLALKRNLFSFPLSSGMIGTLWSVELCDLHTENSD